MAFHGEFPRPPPSQEKKLQQVTRDLTTLEEDIERKLQKAEDAIRFGFNTYMVLYIYNRNIYIYIYNRNIYIYVYIHMVYIHRYNIHGIYGTVYNPLKLDLAKTKSNNVGSTKDKLGF